MPEQQPTDEIARPAGVRAHHQADVEPRSTSRLALFQLPHSRSDVPRFVMPANVPDLWERWRARVRRWLGRST